jgi:hypothetical protein
LTIWSMVAPASATYFKPDNKRRLAPQPLCQVLGTNAPISAMLILFSITARCHRTSYSATISRTYLGERQLHHLSRINTAYSSAEPDQDRYIVTPVTRARRPDAPRMCRRSSIGDNGARADAGATHRIPGVSCAQPPSPPPHLLIRVRQRFSPSGLDRPRRPRHNGPTPLSP